MHHPLIGAPLEPARIVIADDDALFRADLRQLLKSPSPVVAQTYGTDVGPGLAVVAEAAACDDAIHAVRTSDPNVLLVGQRLADMPGIRFLAALREAGENVRAVLLPDRLTRSELAEAIRLGTRGIVVKTAAADVLLEAIHWVLEGRCWLDRALLADFIATARPLIELSHRAGHGAALTRREREVLGFIVAGYANKEIARVSSVTEDSIKHHLTRIYEKLGVSNRVELATLATEHGLLNS